MKKLLALVFLFVLTIGLIAKDNSALTLGNPSNAEQDTLSSPNNYLIEHETFSISYNRDYLIPNWVAWHLDISDLGTGRHSGTFVVDPLLPDKWEKPKHSYYNNSGFDRGHLCPNADRNNYNLGKETFITTNIVPQTPALNRGPWKDFEDYCRKLVEEGNELYIYAGIAEIGGESDTGKMTSYISKKHVAVPRWCWKVVLVLPVGDNDISRIDEETNVIAVCMPNLKSCKLRDLRDYVVTCRYVEEITGYNFFEQLPISIQDAIEVKHYQLE